jgi:restriction system protein
MITTTVPDTWQDLQESVARIFSECRFTVEVEKSITTVRGKVDIDVFAQEEIQGRRFTTLCECKHWKNAVPQNVIHGFRTVVGDIGANKGYIISTGGFQSGAFSAAELTNIELVTWPQFQDAFERSWLLNFFSPVILKSLSGLMTHAEGFGAVWLQNLTSRDKKKYWALQEKHAALGWLLQRLAMHPMMRGEQPYPTLPLRTSLADQYDMTHMPPEIVDAMGYFQVLDAALEKGGAILGEFRAMQAKAERKGK